MRQEGYNLLLLYYVRRNLVGFLPPPLSEANTHLQFAKKLFKNFHFCMASPVRSRNIVGDGGGEMMTKRRAKSNFIIQFLKKL